MHGQPEPPDAWFRADPGRVLLGSEAQAIRDALAERPALAWLWLAPVADVHDAVGRGLRLAAVPDGWNGSVRCALPLPLPSESIGTVVLQHVLRRDEAGKALLRECARVLAPGGQLWLFALNPLAPYRWRWRAAGLQASEPLIWRRRLRAAGLSPDSISQGIGPRWRVEASPGLQPGPGLRAAYVLRAEKRERPLTPRRAGERVALPQGLSAA